MAGMKRVDRAALETVIAAARANVRRRMNRNLHEMSDPIHRLLNAMEPDSYVQPHRHLAPPKRETLLALAGRGAILCFDDGGRITDVAIASPDGPDFVIEIEAGTWHTLIALEPGTVWFEAKEGPYVAPPPADVASWSPAPGSKEAAVLLARWTRDVATMRTG